MSGMYPECTQCIKDERMPRGVLLPLSDQGRIEHTSLTYKAHCCSNRECGFAVSIANGQPGYFEHVGLLPERRRRDPAEKQEER